MRRFRRLSAILAAVMLAGMLPAATIAGSGGRVVAAATGAGVAGALEVSFQFNAIGRADGSASGRFVHWVVLGDLLIEFEGTVTCVTMDAANHRAWIGGIITANNSEHPDWLQEQHEPGEDIWFRVLDNGEGRAAEADRATFVGFKGTGGIETSDQYCATKPWSDSNAGTSALNQGNLQVHD